MARSVEAIARDAVDELLTFREIWVRGPDDPRLEALAELYAEGFRRKGFLAAVVQEEMRRGIYTERMHEETLAVWSKLTAAGVETGVVPGIQ